MARLSDLTYLTRAVFVSWTYLWFLQHVWNIDRFEALKWERIKKHDLKSIITVVLLVMCPLQIFYDASISVLKYEEGYWVNPLNGEIISKPNELFTASNQKFIVYSNYILCANFSLMTCLLFLLQTFWNYLAKNLAKTSFMGSFEFKSYIIYATISVFIFPSLQYIFRNNILLTEVMPQLVYSILTFLIAIVGLRSHNRFANLLRLTRKSSATPMNIISKLVYFRDMNRYLTWSLLLGSSSLMILSIDGLTEEKYLNTHKFTSDFIICNSTFALWVVFVSLMLIFYPSSSTISDSIAMSKGASFSGNSKKTKSDTLEPPAPQWLNTDESQWSSQASSQQTNSQMDNNSHSVEIFDELPPPIPYHERKSNSLEIPHTPPSPYRPYPSIPPNVPPPPPPSSQPPPQNVRQKLVINTAQLTQPPTSMKQSKLEKLKYPSSPLLSRNNSFDNGLGSDNNQSTSSLINNPAPIQSNTQIISPSPSKVFVDYSLNSPTKPTLPKKSSRRPSVTSNDTYPVIRNMTSTTSLSSLKSANSITLPSSDEDDKELSTINKITNLDTRKVAPFMYQDGPPVQQERSIPPVSRSHLSNNIKAEEKQQSQRSIFQRDILTEVSSQSSPKLNSVKSSSVVVQQSQRIPSLVVDDNNDNNNGSSAPQVASTPTINNTSRTPLKSKTQTITRTYQNSPLGPRSKGGIGTNEIASSTSNSSTIKKSSPAQINNSKISTSKGRSGVGAAGAASSVRNSVISTRSRSNSTASVGSNKVNSTSATSNVRNSVRSSVSSVNSVNSVSNSVRNSLVKSRTRSNSTASVGVRNSVRSSTSSGAGRTSIISQNGKTAGRNRTISSASSSSISSVSSSLSSSSSSSSSSSGSIKKVIKTGIGKIKRDSRVS